MSSKTPRKRPASPKSSCPLSSNQNAINAIINILAQQILANRQYSNMLHGPQKLQGSAGPAGAAGYNQLIDTHWRIEEFGYFQPDL